MELMLRLLDNDNLSYDDVNSIKDDVEYYLQSNQDADFQEDETIYDALGLDEFENKDGGLDVLKQVFCT
jgi:CCR4-NOT transcription complex subunit 3